MNKQIINGLLLLGGTVIMTGCIATTQPAIGKVEKVETTREVLIPHDDNVKKATAILIHKVNKIEVSLKELKEKNDAKAQVNTDINTSKIDSMNTKLEEMNKKIIKLSDELSRQAENNKPLLIDKNFENLSSEYDQVIKDFALEENLK